MTDEVSTTPEPEDQPTEQQTTSQTEESTSQEPQNLTADEYRKIAREEAQRAAQSLVDKAEVRLTRKAQDQIKALEVSKATLGLTDKQVADAKQKIITDDLTALPTQPSADSQPVHPLLAATEKQFRKEGVAVEQTDPEFATIKSAWEDPDGNEIQYAAAVAKAIADKKARTASATEKAKIRAAGTGGGATTNPNDISKINDSKTLYEMGDAQMRKGKK